MTNLVRNGSRICSYISIYVYLYYICVYAYGEELNFYRD